MELDKKNAYFGEISLYESIIMALISSFIVLFTDKTDVFSHIVYKYGLEEVIIVACFFVTVVALCFVRRHYSDLLRMPCGNTGDEILVAVCISCVLIIVCEMFLSILKLYKFIILVIITVVSFIIIVCRYVFCRKRRKTVNEISSQLIDLGQILSGDVLKLELPLIFSEEASEYDLLGREGLVNVIYNSIKTCNTNHVYVIGLNGAWGSGKTTLLNIVKKRLQRNKNDVIVIDDFDPWIFGSQEALLSGMYDVILSKTGIQYSTYNSKQIIQKLKETVANKNNASKIFNILLENNQRDYETVKILKEKIGLYLSQLGRTIVFIIDNLDRADADNILFIFKLIGSVFDLPNIVYVLAYDETRIKNVFSDINKVNPKYIEKIVQQEIAIPEIQKNTMTMVCSSCIERTLLAYGVHESDITHFNNISALICKNVSDLRQFKRLLNSSFVSTFFYDNELYKPHLLAIEVIRFLEPSLYEEIKRNKKYFVSKDLYCSDEGLYLEIIDKKVFNESAKKYYSDLFNKFESYKDILAWLFPYVKRYKDGNEPLNDYAYVDDAPEHNSIASIASGKFFDLYFSYGTNSFLRIISSVERFIGIVNSSEIHSIIGITEKSIEAIELDSQCEWFERLQNKIETINVMARKEVALGICNSISRIDTTRGFLMLSADQRALVVATILFKDLDKVESTALVEVLSKNYNIRLLEEILRNCSSFQKKGNSSYVELEKIVERKYIDLCNKILNENIDIYSEQFYQRWKVWALYHSQPDDNKNVFHAYMRNLINLDNVFKILGDMITESTGTLGFGYFLNEEYIEKLLGDKEILKNVMSEAVPNNETEKFILNLWKRMESGEMNEFGTKEFYSPVPIRLVFEV